VEETEIQVKEHPVHHLAVPLFILTSLPYFGAVLYDYLNCCKTDSTFAWFGAFYLGLGGIYLIKKFVHRQSL